MPPTTAKHHAEWLSLLEISGPFLSMPVLLCAFPQGLDEFPPEQARSLKADYEFWRENPFEPAVFTGWVKLVLESMLGYSGDVLLDGQAIPAGIKAEFPEHDETLRPNAMLAEPGTHKPRLLIQVYPPDRDLDKAPAGSHWQASAATRMMELLHATEIRLGLITNGEQWMLVDAPRSATTGFITWYASLWFDESLTLRAFRSLLGVQRFFGVPDDQTLEALLTASAEDQQEITDQLGLQVRHAVEILVQMIDRADQDSRGSLLGQDVPPALLYEAALTFMMRLVFLLAAEERKLLPLDDALYAENYAVSTLRAQLRDLADQHGEEVLERRFDAWSRLLAAFRAVYHGIQHDRLHLPPYGGSLFNPDKYPFLEGRPAGSHWQDSPAQPLPVNNRTVLHLLDALQILQVAVPGGGPAEARRLSFRALDVEQIGHVYEGLLDHIAVRAEEPVLGLRGAKRQEPEIGLSTLEQAAGRPLSGTGKESDFIAWLTDQTGRSAAALKNALAGDLLQRDPDFAHRLRLACGNDERLLGRIAPFAGLVRTDDFGFPVVILSGSVYVTAGTTRRATGTHYTPRILTEPIVQHTLEPLVYLGPAEGWPREQWQLRPAKELLDLKICDMAMGSAGFLVQADRYLAERVVEAWAEQAEKDEPWTDDPGLRSAVESLSSDEDRLIFARRLVAERCLYGVDKNPLAVEIAKLSLWLVTLAKERPFTFLNHALKCGDSLVGASEDDFLRWAHGYKASTMTLFDEQLRLQLETARVRRRELEAFEVKDVRDSELKAALLKEADAAMAHIKRGCDLLTGARLLGLSDREIEELQLGLLFPYMAGELDGFVDAGKHPDAASALNVAKKERIFHWEFEFPEVFEQGGFSAFVGNPPFLGGVRIARALGDKYLEYLRGEFESWHGQADLCAFFFVRTFELVKKKGTVGLIATNTISQTDTRESSLDFITKSGGEIYTAYSSMQWPGLAAVYVSLVHLINGTYLGERFLNDVRTNNITSHLDNQEQTSEPKKLIANDNKSFLGSSVVGIGFVVEPDKAKDLISRNPKNTDVLFPYLIGQDLNSNYDQSPSRWIINFSDWTLEDCQKYPECLDIVKTEVYPARMLANRKAHKERWWQYGDRRPELYNTLKNFDRVLAVALTSKTVAFSFVDTSMVFAHSLGLFALRDLSYFACLQSSLHYYWALRYGSTMKSDLRYTPSDIFETFPFPNNMEELVKIGDIYYEHRRQTMLARQEGLTSTYNRFHDPDEHSEDIVQLRRLHVEMDQAVAAAYGWSDLDLGHGFNETAQGVRYTISESARREVLSRLLKLNHERYEEEVKAGLHEKKSKGKGERDEKGLKKAKKRFKDDGQLGLF